MGEGTLDVWGPPSAPRLIPKKGWAPREAPLYLDAAGSSRHRPMGSSELLPKGLGTKRGTACLPTYLPGARTTSQRLASAGRQYTRGGRGRRQGRSNRKAGAKKGGGAGRGPLGLTRDECPRGGATRLPGCRREPAWTSEARNRGGAAARPNQIPNHQRSSPSSPPLRY